MYNKEFSHMEIIDNLPRSWRDFINETNFDPVEAKNLLQDEIPLQTVKELNGDIDAKFKYPCFD